MMKPTPVYLALGSNLGDRQTNLIKALRRLRQKVTIERLSSVYETEPAYVADQPRFYNLVLQGSTNLSPEALLRFLKNIEQSLGREKSIRYGPRLIDVDILLYGRMQLETPDLVIPHPRLAERAFVLVPLAEIAPDLIIPGQQHPVAALVEQLGPAAPGEVVRVLSKIALD